MKKPRLRTLETFEAVARLGSVTRAAEELRITQSAVSHQLKHLSDEVGEVLILRSGRSIKLTEAGKLLSIRLRTAFAQIDQSLVSATGSGREIVRLSLCSCFSRGWMAARMTELRAAYPEFQLQMNMYASDPELTDRVADAFITTLPTEAGYWSMLIVEENLIAVGAPETVARGGASPLVTTSDAAGAEWADYCRRANLSLDRIRDGQWIMASHYVVALDLARQGAGLALIPDFLAEKPIRDGEIAALSDIRLPTSEDYHLCIKNARRDEPQLSSLISWFRSQVAADPARNGQATYEFVS